jgi:hypothetical protein
LAARAGVGERTIRNAEVGRIIEGSTASYIAGALEVGLEILVKSHPDGSSQFSIPHFERAFREAFLHGQTNPLKDMLHPYCQWRIIGVRNRNSYIHLETAQSLNEGFESIRATAPWNQPLHWYLNREESAILSDSFFIITTITSLMPPSKTLKFRTSILGRLHQERCASITQTWEEESME